MICMFYRFKTAKQVEIVNCLLEKCDPDRQTDEGKKPLDMTSNPYIRRALIRKGANPFPTDSEITDTVVKIFILGDPGGGKSTLMKAMTTERSLFSLLQRYVKVKDVDERTAGVIPYEVETKSLGKAIINDFAGQKEYHASHDEVLYNSMTDSPSVIILVVNVAQDEEKIKTSVSYWFNFIQTVRDRCEGNREPHLWIVGGHADKVSSGKKISLLVNAVVKTHSLNGIIYQGHIITDCRYAHSSSTSQVRISVSRSCQELRDIEAITIEHHCFLKFLLDKFKDKEGVVLSMVDAELRHNLDSDDHTYLECVRSSDSFKMCEKLNERGDILFMRNQNNPGSSWIVLDTTTLLSKVNGVIFAPEGFKEYQNLPSNTGVISLSKLVSLFPDLDSDMITRFLCHLEFCQEIVDSDLKSLLLSHTNSPSTPNERFFFFPCLVCLNRPKLDILSPDSSNNYFKHKSGWVLQCSQFDKFFSIRFLHVLILRLAFKFTHTSSISDSLVVHRRCKVWKTGIHWANRSGSEAIVDVFDLKRVVVIVCSKDEKMELIKLRSAIINVIINTSTELCPKISVNEYLIPPEDTSTYPVSRHLSTLVSINELAETIKDEKMYVLNENDQAIQLDKLIHFEPYANLGNHNLKILFHSKDDEEIISDEVLNDIAEHVIQKYVNEYYVIFTSSCKMQVADERICSGNVQTLVEVLQLWKMQEGTIYHFKQKLNQFSIFAGRNPFDYMSDKGTYYHDNFKHCQSFLSTHFLSLSGHSRSSLVGSSCQETSPKTELIQESEEVTLRRSGMHVIYVAYL